MNRADLIRLVLGDQLNERHSWFSRADPGVLVVMMEIRPETEYVTHHVQKLLAVFGAMRRFAARLRELGHRVLYLEITDPRNRHVFSENLAWIAGDTGAAGLETQQPDEYRLSVQLDPARLSADIRAASGQRLVVRATETEHFLIPHADADRFLPPDKKPMMEYFYRRVRRHFGWLMEDDGKPVGGKWNWDNENRGRWSGPPDDPEAPVPFHGHNDLTEEMDALTAAGCIHIGSAVPGDLPWPITRVQGLAALEHFLSTALPWFGTYQDAMHSGRRSLFHSRLSFALNVKLISPAEVIEAAIGRWRAPAAAGPPVRLNQIEGFLRQIAGWREYMRLLYWRLMPGLADANALDADLPLPSWYWTGKTRMHCLAGVITQSLEDAYAHHIQRLMVTGAFAMMAGVDPKEVDAWYLGIYIDAFDWVERPNTRGMSQYADGGVIATKPYAATARYISRQSDYCNGCEYNGATRTDEDSCPWNVLYWDFYMRNPDLKKNRRVAFAFAGLERMGDEERSAIAARAAWLRRNLERL